MGFSRAFGLGLAEGLFESTANNMSAFLERDREEAKEIAKDESDIIRADSARYNTEYQGYKKEMRDLLGKVDNDPDALQYIISKYGYETAKKYINDIHDTHQTQGGLKVSEMFKLAERDSGQPSVTIEQLARMQTTPVTVPKSRDYSKLGGGFTRLFGGQDAMQDMITTKIESRTSGLPGVGATLDDIPQARLAIDPLEGFEVGALADPAQETERLTRLAINAKLSGDNELASRLTNRRDVKLIQAEVNRNVATGESLTTSQKNIFREKILQSMKSKHKFDATFDANGTMRFGDTGAEIAQEINSKADTLLAQAVDLMQMGYASELVMDKIKQSVFTNQPIKYDTSIKRISPSDDPIGQINEDIIFSQGQNLVDTSILIQDITKAINFEGTFIDPTTNDPLYSESQVEDIRNVLRELDITDPNSISQIIDTLDQMGVPKLHAQIMINLMTK